VLLPAGREPVISSFVSALSTVFVSAVPVVLLVFVLTWFLQETQQRGRWRASVRSAARSC